MRTRIFSATTIIALVVVTVGCTAADAPRSTSTPVASVTATPTRTAESSDTPVASPSPTPRPTPPVVPDPSPSATLRPASASPAWIATGAMGNPRRAHSATLLRDGRVLVVGGLDESSAYVTQAEIYDPASGSWSAAGSLLEGRRGHSATLLPDGTVLVAGGWTDRDETLPSASVALFDPSSGKWMATESMADVRAGHTATLLPDGTVLIAGGLSYNGGNGAPLDRVETFDPLTSSWNAAASMTEPRGAHTATLLADGTVLVTGGIGRDTEEVAPMNTTLSTAETYDPRTASWTTTGDLHEGRADHSATLLPDETVLVTRMGREGSAERYDPVRRTFAGTGDMRAVRFWHTATLLPNGQVLVTGAGSDGSKGAGRASELYDPSTESWSATAEMVRSRVGHTATRLLDDLVLVSGGQDASGAVRASAELYIPDGGS